MSASAPPNAACLQRPLPPLPSAADGVRLRPFRDDDCAALLAADADGELTRWLALSRPLNTEDDALEWMEEGHWFSDNGNGVRVAVIDADGTLLGCVEMGVHGDLGTVGYWTAPWARGTGVASRAVALLCDWAIAHRLVTCLRLLTLEGNVASERVAARCGFERYGTVTCYEPRLGQDACFNQFRRLVKRAVTPAPHPRRR